MNSSAVIVPSKVKIAFVWLVMNRNSRKRKKRKSMINNLIDKGCCMFEFDLVLLLI